MSSTNHVASVQEAAADYGVRERCFRNHQCAPFRWQDASAALQTAHPVSTGRIVEVPGLRPIQIHGQQYHLCLQDSLDSFDIEAFSSLENSVNVASLLPSGRSCTNGLKLDTSILDLGPEADRHVYCYLEDIRSVLNFDFRHTWLPLSSVNNGRDEGLAFPKRSNALHALLWRELYHDQPALPDQGRSFPGSSDPISSSKANHWVEPVEPMVLRVSEASVPLLSPVSNSQPLAPESGTIVIDLCTSPETPVEPPISLLLEDLKRGHLESDPAIPEFVRLTKPDDPSDKLFKIRCVGEENKKVEIPLPPASWDSQRDDGKPAFSEACADLAVLKLPSSGPEMSEHFTGAFDLLLADRHEKVMQSIKQEQLDPSDSYSRLAVPALSFEICAADPDPEAQSQPAEVLFQSLLRASHPNSKFDRIKRNDRLETALSWNPVPKGKGENIALDEAPSSEQTPDAVLYPGPERPNGSALCVSYDKHVLVLQKPDDNELAEPPERVLLSDAHPEEPQREIPAYGVASAMPARVSGKPSLSELCRNVSRKRQSAAISLHAESLVDAEDMLAGFVELRTGKRRKLVDDEDHLPGSQTGSPTKKAAVTALVPLESPPDTQTAATVPSFSIPMEKSHKIMSMTVGRSVMRHITKVWPPELLIDRDYSKHNTIAWSPGTTQTQAQTSPLCVEADISLNASTGVIVTSLLKVRQRALPGSSGLLPHLRERIKQVSDLYEHLTVLVSEENSQSDCTSSLVNSDLAGYVDFVQFATSLRKGVTVHFVPGHDETLSKWILSLFCRSTYTTDFERFFTWNESVWEVFLRRIGLNVCAAQVVAGLLQERIGASGLGSFMTMPRRERISAFEQVLGGRRVLNFVSNVIDTQW